MAKANKSSLEKRVDDLLPKFEKLVRETSLPLPEPFVKELLRNLVTVCDACREIGGTSTQVPKSMDAIVKAVWNYTQPTEAEIKARKLEEERDSLKAERDTLRRKVQELQS